MIREGLETVNRSPAYPMRNGIARDAKSSATRGGGPGGPYQSI